MSNDQIKMLLKERRKKLAIMDRIKGSHMKYLALQEEVLSLESSVKEELMTALVTPDKRKELLGDKKDPKPRAVGIISLPDGSQVVLSAQLQKCGNCVAGLNEVRHELETNDLKESLKHVDTAIEKIKADKAKANEDKRDLDFKIIIDDKGPEPEITDQDLDITSGFTKIGVCHYPEHVIKEFEGKEVRFRYRAKGKGPAMVERKKGKDGDDADLVEGACLANGVFKADNGNLTIRVRNRNYRTTEDTPSQVPGNVYQRQEGDYPPINYTVAQIIPGTFEVCWGNKWKVVVPAA